MTERRLDVAQHEAAHVVVGVALGLRLHVATAAPAGDLLGYAWFPWGGTRLADSLCTAAGVAWEESVGGTFMHRNDLIALRKIERSAAGVRAAVRAAAAMLRGLQGVHLRVTKALLEGDLKHHHILALARGERLEADE